MKHGNFLRDFTIIIIIALIITAVLSYFEKGKMHANNSNTTQSKSCSIAGIKNIQINSSSTDIEIIAENKSDLTVELSQNFDGFGTPSKLNVSKENDTLNISVDQNQNGFFIGMSNPKLEVYVPVKYKENLTAYTSSGTIDVNSLNTALLSLSASSGDIKSNNLTADKFDVTTSSGDISGNKIKTKQSTFKASSGSIDVSDFSGDIVGSVSSGNINISYNTYNNNIELNSHSGNIDLNLPNDSEFKLDADTSSGDIDNSFDITSDKTQEEHKLSGIVKSDTNTVNLSTSSGNITIK